ncbi:MAG TPA: hypothetical protein VGR36_01645 [Candidatus Acidoferrales bacterium]|nr:hypothetical protein [Candidatus Acidoferrales bacterium]
MKRRLCAAATSVALITIAAIGLRAAFLWNYAGHNPHHALGIIPFLFESGNIAVSLATGHGFASPFRVPTGPTAWTTPVYPGLLAGIFRVFGTYTFAAFLAACAINILATGLACIPIFYTGKRIGGVATGAAAAWLWAVFPNAIEIPSTSMWDASLAALLAAMILWATIALADCGDASTREPNRASRAIPWDWIGYGLLWGIAMMTTATLIGLLPFLIGWIMYRRWKLSAPEDRRPEKLLAKPALAVAIAALCCLPWTIRNYEVFHAFVPMRSILGLQLWVGNNPQAKTIWLGTQHPIHDSAERAKYVQMGEIAYMQQKEHDALDYMAAHPTRDAYLAWKRFVEFWSGGTPTPVSDLFRSRSAWFDLVLLFNLLTGIGALAGIIVLLRRRSEYWFPLAVFPVVFPWAYYLTVVMPRYGLPIDPAVMLLTAVAIGTARREGTAVERGKSAPGVVQSRNKVKTRKSVSRKNRAFVEYTGLMPIFSQHACREKTCGGLGPDWGGRFEQAR